MFNWFKSIFTYSKDGVEVKLSREQEEKIRKKFDKAFDRVDDAFDELDEALEELKDV